MIYTAIYYSSYTTHNMSLHSAGCQDITKDTKEHGGTTQDIEAASLKDALNEMVDSEMVEMGYTHKDVKVLPCARPPRKRTGAKAAAVAYPCKGKWSVCGGQNEKSAKANWNLCPDCTARRAQMKV